MKPMKKTRKTKTPKKPSSGRTATPVRPDLEREPPRPAAPRDGNVAPDGDATAEFKAGKDI